MCTPGDIITGSLSDGASNNDHIDSLMRPCRRPFDTLPTELIQSIFLLTCPLVNLPGEQCVMGTRQGVHPALEDPLILSMVCRRWQDITTAYHSLWATLSIMCGSMGYEAWCQWGFSKLDNYLNRSGPDQALKIRINDQIILNDSRVISGSLAQVAQHTKRWGNMTFDFILGPAFLRELNPIVGQLPLLENLDLYVYGDSSVPTPPTSSTAGDKYLDSLLLKRISFRSSLFPKEILQLIPWHQIHDVTFRRATFSSEQDLRQTLECLSVSTTQLTLEGVYIRFSGTEPSIFGTQRPVVLEKVHKLQVRAFRSLVDSFVCPSLKHFEIGGDERQDQDEDKIVHFLKKSSCALTHMHIYSDVQPGRGDLRKYYTIFSSASLSTLRSLSLQELTDSILDLLNFDSHKLLPCLDTLSLEVVWRIERVGGQYITSRIEGLRQVVESRTKAGSSMETAQAALSSPLKCCYFTFSLYTDRPRQDDEDHLAETLLEELRLFCISRKIRIQQGVHLPTPPPR